jgi:hypothetical protein
MLAYPIAPVAHPLVLFQPQWWGYFLGGNVGVAWEWWALTLGLILVWYHVLRTLGGERWVSAGLVILLTFSPFIQFWSLTAVRPAIGAGLCVLAAIGLLRARSPAACWAMGVALGWSAGCFVFAVYPPFQIPFAYLAVALVIGAAWDQKSEIAWKEHPFARASGAALALVVLSAALLSWWHDAGDAIRIMAGSTYPGNRISTGGDRPLWAVFSGNFAPALVAQNFGSLGNVCEAASYWLFFPMLAGGWALRTLRDGVRPDAITVSLLCLCALLLWHGQLGLYEPIARSTLLAHSPGPRASVVLGFADVVLLALWLESRPRLSASSTSALVLLFMLLLGGCAWYLRDAIRGIPDLYFVLLLGLNAVLAWLLLRGRWPRFAVGTACALGIGATIWFNPVVAGGSDYLRTNPLSQRILEIDRQAGGHTTWVAYSAPLVANLFRTLGIRCINGVLPIPQPETWRWFDMEGRFEETHNRFAHVLFEAAAVPRPQFKTQGLDLFSVETHPRDPVLLRIGVTHALARTDDPEAFASRWNVELLGVEGGYALYRVDPVPEIER